MTLDTKRIKYQLDELAQADPGDARRWLTNAPWSEDRLREFEARYFELPADYRAWLRDVGDGGIGMGFLHLRNGMRQLGSQSKQELALAAKPFRVKGDSTRPPRRQLGGTLRLGEDAQLRPFFLVTTGKRAGEIWIDGEGWGDSVFYKEGTFGELTRTWMDEVVAKARAEVAAGDPAELEGIAPKDRFAHLLYPRFVPWLRLRDAPAVFAEAVAHVEPSNRSSLIDLLVRAIEGEKRWTDDPVLARVAGDTLAAVLAQAEGPGDALDHALDAMYEPDPPDIAPDRLTAYLAAVATRRGQRDDRINRWTGRWLQHELVQTGRVEEAVLVWRHRSYRYDSDWAEFARDLIAVGRPDVAFALADEEKFAADGHWGAETRDRVRAWMHFEAGDRDAAIVWMERHVAQCRQCGSELAVLRSENPVQSPPNLTTGWAFDRPRARRGQRHHELVALLYGVAGNGDRMADSALALLSRPQIVRHAEEQVIHRAHLRMGRALAGNGNTEREPLVVNYGSGVRRRLARAILARCGDLRIDVKGD